MTKPFRIASLGPRRIPSPLLDFRDHAGHTIEFVDDRERILVDDREAVVRSSLRRGEALPWLEVAGPRRKLFFDPRTTRIGIATCGGLCPGLNNVIRSIVMSASFAYGVKRILGFRYGYRGIVERDHLRLDPELVSEIHTRGGTILGSSRGEQETGTMVDRLVQLRVNILFLIGGDGTMRGALDLASEIRRRRLRIAVIGVPKTIDNDMRFMDQSFGYLTAYGKAVEAIDGAHREAQGAPNGVGLVKLMGRHSGFIACSATVASGHVNFTLIPEVPFRLDGPRGFLEALRRRLERRQHAMVVVAEGAGQDLVRGSRQERDASGNVKLLDIGSFLVEQMKSHFRANRTEINLKYIDPSYLIRSVPASPPDAVFCTGLGFNAVHAAMCGKTEILIGLWHRRLVHVPIQRAIHQRNVVDPKGPLWLGVLGSTGQPLSLL